MRVLILLVAASAILPGTDAAGKPAGASDSRSPYSTEDVVSARESGRFTLDFVMKAAADGSGGVIEDWIRAGGSVDDRDAKAPRRGQTTESPVVSRVVSLHLLGRRRRQWAAPTHPRGTAEPLGLLDRAAMRPSHRRFLLPPRRRTPCSWWPGKQVSEFSARYSLTLYTHSLTHLLTHLLTHSPTDLASGKCKCEEGRCAVLNILLDEGQGRPGPPAAIDLGNAKVSKSSKSAVHRA